MRGDVLVKGTALVVFFALIIATLASPYIEEGIEEVDDYNDYNEYNLGRFFEQAMEKRGSRWDTPTRRSCIKRGGNCEHQRKNCCYKSSCRCNLWGSNCRCQQGILQKMGK